MTKCEGCVNFIEIYDGYDKERRENVWKKFCRLDKTYSEDDPCWKEPLCDLEIIKTFTPHELSDFQLAVENIGKSAKELLAWVTEHGFDARGPFRTRSYTVEQLRAIIRKMNCINDDIIEMIK